MSAFEANNPFDLLGQTPQAAPAVELHGSTEPQLKLAWGEFHQGVASNFAELFRRARISKKLISASYFRDVVIDNPWPARAIVAAALWHFVFLAIPFPQFAAPKKNPAFANTQITWSGPIQDFPLIHIPAAKAKPSPRGTAAQSAAPEGADAFHPRQTIFTDPVRPTHPRQTLLNPSAPPIAPKVLPNLPNMVQLAQSAAPVKPRLEISQDALKTFHPHQKHIAVDPNAPAPDVQAAEQRAADLTLAVNNNAPERPKLQINANAAPRVTQRKDNASEPAPDVAAQLTSPTGSSQALIALSANPGPPTPAAPPAGNTAARVTMSPEGKKPGVPGGVPDAKPGTGASATANPNANAGGTNSGGGSGTSSTAVSITGGAPHSGNVASGLGGPGKIAMPSTRPLYTRAEADRAASDADTQTTPPNFALLAPGAKPEAIFQRRRVYSMNVNMPNLNSATGSWILNFAEKRAAATGPLGNTGEVAAPSPLKKVDPKYPPTLAAEHVEGEVVLYAVIRRDGSVDSIQVVRSVDPLLDANSARALAQWKFAPAERNGEPVDLEAIVHIPFHTPDLR